MFMWRLGFGKYSVHRGTVITIMSSSATLLPPPRRTFRVNYAPTQALRYQVDSLDMDDIEDLEWTESPCPEAPRVSEQRARKTLIDFCKHWATTHNYKLVILRSQWTDKKNWKAVKGRVWIGCSLSGQHRRKEPSSETTYKSRKCDRPF